jgi:hypothetical protein
MAAEPGRAPELSAGQRGELLRVLCDELDQAYRALDLPADELSADLRRRRDRLGPPPTGGLSAAPGLSPCADHGCAGEHRVGRDRNVDDAQDGVDDAVDRAAIGE